MCLVESFKLLKIQFICIQLVSLIKINKKIPFECVKTYQFLQLLGRQSYLSNIPDFVKKTYQNVVFRCLLAGPTGLRCCSRTEKKKNQSRVVHK